jgi:hypothetical protein
MKLANYLYTKKLSNLFDISMDEVNRHLLSQSETERLKNVFLKYKDSSKKFQNEINGKDSFYDYLKNLLNYIDENTVVFYMEGALDFGAFILDKTDLISNFEKLVKIEEGIFAISSQDGKGNILIDISKNDPDFSFCSEIEGKWANEQFKID